MDVGKEFRIAHNVIVYSKEEGGERVFSILYDDPMDASYVVEWINKVIKLTGAENKLGVSRKEIIIHKQVDKELIKDFFEEYVL